MGAHCPDWLPSSVHDHRHAAQRSAIAEPVHTFAAAEAGTDKLAQAGEVN